jgi:hypothetical protein
MKNLINTIALIACIASTNAQTTQYTWMSGYNSPNHAGIYSSKGIATTTCMPGTRSLSSSWTDTLGNLWLFGGTIIPLLICGHG